METWNISDHFPNMKQYVHFVGSFSSFRVLYVGYEGLFFSWHCWFHQYNIFSSPTLNNIYEIFHCACHITIYVKDFTIKIKCWF